MTTTECEYTHNICLCMSMSHGGGGGGGGVHACVSLCMYTCTLHCVSDVVVCTGKVIFVRPHLLRPASSPDYFLMM